VAPLPPPPPSTPPTRGKGRTVTRQRVPGSSSCARLIPSVVFLPSFPGSSAPPFPFKKPPTIEVFVGYVADRRISFVLYYPLLGKCDFSPPPRWTDSDFCIFSL